jgi:hypothetical protein
MQKAMSPRDILPDKWEAEFDLDEVLRESEFEL